MTGLTYKLLNASLHIQFLLSYHGRAVALIQLTLVYEYSVLYKLSRLEKLLTSGQRFLEDIQLWCAPLPMSDVVLPGQYSYSRLASTTTI